MARIQRYFGANHYGTLLEKEVAEIKVLKRIKTTIYNSRESIKRFPATILISVMFVILLIYSNENRINLNSLSIEKLTKLNMTIGLGIVLSLCISLLIENREKKNNLFNILIYGLGTIFLVLFYFLFLDKLKMVQKSRYLGTLLFLILAFFYIPKIKRGENYEKYVIKIFSGGFLTAIYSGVLFLGITAILLTIDGLFDVNINGKYYYYLFLMIVFIFGINLFLSKIPKHDESLEDKEYSKTLKVLLVYIVIPLLTAYNIILYAYFLKILITLQWPRGLVSHLVLWSSALSIAVIFLITPVLKENSLGRKFKIYFPKFILPLLAMMFISIWQRVNQYGITENRFYIIVFGLWILGMMLYFSFKKPLRNIFIPISLSIVVLISIYGPFSSFSLSIRSQNNRLNGILETNGMLEDGKVIANTNLSSDDKKEINNIIYYFNNTHSLEDIKALPKGFETSGMRDLFGFDYSPYSEYENEENYFYYNANLNNKLLDISGFDYYSNMSSWNGQTISMGDITLSYNPDIHLVTIQRDNILLLEQDVMPYVQNIHNKKKDVSDKAVNDIEDVTYISENENIKAKFIFTNINGRTDIENNITIDGLELVVLIDIL